MGRLRYPAVAVLLAFAQLSAHAQTATSPVSEDCTAILESYATDPKSVAKSAVDACQQAINIAPGAGAAAAQEFMADGDAVDPCGGPDAGSSVQCWGPWAAPLSPQAGGGEGVPAELVAYEYDPRPEVLGLDPPIPDPPLTPCEPGLPCGFATVVDGTTSQGPAEDTSFASFDLASDGTAFTVSQDGEAAIESTPGMSTNYTPRPDGLENLRAQGAAGDQRSRLIARVLRQGDDIQYAADVWADGNVETREARSGFFAYGVAAGQADIDALTAGNISLNFTGPMSVDNATTANITLNYGGSPSWSGNWTNPGYAFDAGGTLSGVNFVSDADQFSSNVQEGFVQGALVGGPGSRGVAHAVEVLLDGDTLIRDVGLLPEISVTDAIAR